MLHNSGLRIHFIMVQLLTHIIPSGLVLCGGLDGVGQEAEDGADPQQNGEATKKLATELDPFWGGGGWS